MAVIGALNILLGMSAADVVAGARKSVRALTELESRTRMTAAAVRTLETTMGALGIGVGLVEGIEFLKSSVEAYREAAREQKKLEAVLVATDHAAGFTSQQLGRMNSALQAQTNFDDDAVAGGEAVLATFKQIQGVNFTRAVESMLGLSSVMEQDLPTSALQLGKALNDPIRGITALRRVGIAFNAEQEQLIRKFVALGDVARAQTVILDELNSEGFNLAAAKAMRDEITGMTNDWGDLKEAVGSLAETGFAKALFKQASEWVRHLKDDIEAVTQAEDGAINKTSAWLNLLNTLNGGLIMPFGEPLKVTRAAEGGPAGKSQKAPTPFADAADADALSALDKLHDKLREEFQLWGLVGEEREMATLALQGLTADETRETQALFTRVNALRAEAAAQAEAREHAKQLATDIDHVTDSLREETETFGMSAEEVRIWNLRQKGASEAQLFEARRLAKKLAGMRDYREELERTKKLEQDARDEAEKIKEESRTPAERLKTELDRLKQLRDANHLDEQTYQRAQAKARKEAAGAHEKSDVPTALKGSAEAFHAMVRFQRGAGQSVQKKSLDELRKIRAAVAGQAKERKRQAAEMKRRPQSPRRTAELARRSIRATRRRYARVDPHTLKPVPPEFKRTARGRDNAAIAEAKRNRLRLQAEFRANAGVAPRAGDKELLKELERIRDEIAAGTRAQGRAHRPGVVRKI